MGFSIYGAKLRNSGPKGHSLTDKKVSHDKSSKRKRDEESSPAQVDHETLHQEHNYKKRRSLSPSVHQNPSRNKLLPRPGESEPDMNIHSSSPIHIDEIRTEIRTDEKGSISSSSPHDIVREPDQTELPQLETSEPNNASQDESLPQSRGSETDMNLHNCLPTHISEASIDMRSSASSSTHQNITQNESLPSYEEPQIPENMQNPHPNCHEEAIASTSVAARSSPHESENISRMSEEADTVSPIHYSDKSDTNNSLEGFDANPTGEGSFLSDSVQQGNANIVEEPIMESIVETEEHSSHTADILEPLSGLEMTSFISEIRTRTANPSRGRFSRSLGNIMTTLRELVLEINIEELPEIKEFRDMANSLLDCAVISGIDAQELQLWESTLRDIEFGILSIKTAREERSLEECEAAEASYKDIFERATPAYENLQRKLKPYRACQNQIMWASAEVVRFDMELEKLLQRKRYLIRERELVSQDIVIMETDFAQMEAEISELEQISTPLSQELEIASQHLQTIKDQHGHKAAEARAAMARIREIQSRYA